jgi:hypothetical protein
MRKSRREEIMLVKTDKRFVLRPTLSAMGSMAKNLPIRLKKGAPGGWATCIQTAAAEHSPQSQNETEGCTVIAKTIPVIKAIAKAIVLLRSL